MAHYSPLRYPGGKVKMYHQTVKILKDNNLIGCTYIEPFAGGSNLALNLLFEGHVDKIVLNDLDPAVYAFWHSVLFDAPNFIQMIIDTPVNMTEYYKQKQIYNNIDDNNFLQKGFATFYLNRCNRSGIITAGPIGGHAQEGNYLIDCRFNKNNLIKRIQKIYENRGSIELYGMDARDFMQIDFPNNSFMFIDPPYYKQGAYLYKNHFTHEDHVQIAGIVANLHTPWVVTYDNTKEISDIYSFSNNVEYKLSYTVEKKYIGSELMFFQDNLLVDF